MLFFVLKKVYSFLSLFFVFLRIECESKRRSTVNTVQKTIGTRKALVSVMKHCQSEIDSLVMSLHMGDFWDDTELQEIRAEIEVLNMVIEEMESTLKTIQ